MKKKERAWKYFSPRFESDLYNPEMMIYSPWSDHRPFAYDYIRNTKPDNIVELGSYYGCSSFAFLQAIKDEGLNTSFSAIDTWQGDSFTENDYTENIFSAYREIQRSCYAGQNSRMLRMTFDEARGRFEDESIDLLHIDGSHSYEDVKHDFFTWRTAVKKSGAVFFHDVGEDELYGKKMESHIFWEELKQKYPYTMEFLFSFGLGVLFFDKEICESIKNRIDLKIYQQKANLSAAIYKDSLRKDFFAMRDRSIYIRRLETEKTELSEKCRLLFDDTQRISLEYEENVKKYRETLTGKEGFISELEDTVGKYKRSAAAKEYYIAELRETVEKYRTTVSEIKAYLNDLKETVKKYQNTVEKKESYITELRETIEKYRKTVGEKDGYIEELSETIGKFNRATDEKNGYIGELLDTIEQYRHTVSGKEDYITELKENLTKYESTVKTKENYICELQEALEGYGKSEQDKNAYIEELHETIKKYNNTVSKKDDYIEELCRTIQKYKKTDEGKSRYIEELSETIEKYRSTSDGKDSYIEELCTTIEKYRSTSDGKDGYIEELCAAIQKYQITVSGKDSYIEELLGVNKKYQKTVDGKEKYIKELENRLDLCEQREQKYSREKLNLQVKIKEQKAYIKVFEEEIRHLPFGKYIWKRMERSCEH